MGDTNRDAEIKARVNENFATVSREFLTQTRGVIDIANGQDSITQTAAKAFLPDALLHLRENGMDTKTDKESTFLAETLVEAFVRKLEPADQSYVLEHKTDYIQGIHTALTSQKKARPFQLGIIVDPSLLRI